MIATMYKLILCHFLGDYVFQTDFLAKTKGEKWLPYLPEGLRYKCSECGSKYDTPWHFCPNCGSYNGGENYDKG